jgi:hypothetical protein
MHNISNNSKIDYESICMQEVIEAIISKLIWMLIEHNGWIKLRLNSYHNILNNRFLMQE